MTLLGMVRVRVGGARQGEGGEWARGARVRERVRLGLRAKGRR